MWIPTHLLVTTAVFGPRPEALLGAVLPDVLSYANWGTKLIRGKLKKADLLSGEDRVNSITNNGIIWEAHTFLHSFWIAGITLGGAIFTQKNSLSVSIFLYSYFLHIFLDYFTHKIKWWPLIPYKGWKTDFGIFEYNLANWKTVLAIDAFLLLLTALRINFRI